MKSLFDKNFSKSFLATTLAVTLLASSLTGCGTENTSAEKSNAIDTSTATETVAATTNSSGLPIVSEPITLSIFMPSRMAEASVTNDTMTIKELEKRTNIKLDIQTVFNSQVKDKYQLMMASGNLPDIMYSTLANANKYGPLGAFQELNGLIEKSAPNIQKHLVNNKAVNAQAAAADGKLYCVPMLSAIKTAMGYNIRQDWLDKLNLKAPVTIDDWYTVLKAFKEKDPNGNGKADEVPLIFDRMWENYYLNFTDAWKIEADYSKDYWMQKDGKTLFSATAPEFKDFLATMAKWYTEGLIDKEFATREDTNNYHILNNIGGASVYWTGYLAAQNVNKEVLAKDAKTNWQVIAPPVLKAGDEAKTFNQQLEVVPNHSWCISATNKHVDETIKLFDYVYSDEGSILFNFGIENDTYTMDNGTPAYTDKVKNYKEGTSAFMKMNGMMPFIGIRQMPEYEAASCANADIKKQLFDYVDNKRFYETTPLLGLTEAEKDIYTPKMTAIKTYVEEMTLKFMVGSESISKWDEYVAKVDELGIKECTEMMDKAYTRYNALAK